MVSRFKIRTFAGSGQIKAELSSGRVTSASVALQLRDNPAIKPGSAQLVSVVDASLPASSPPADTRTSLCAGRHNTLFFAHASSLAHAGVPDLVAEVAVSLSTRAHIERLIIAAS